MLLGGKEGKGTVQVLMCCGGRMPATERYLVIKNELFMVTLNIETSHDASYRSTMQQLTGFNWQCTRRAVPLSKGSFLSTAFQSAACHLM